MTQIELAKAVNLDMANGSVRSDVEFVPSKVFFSAGAEARFFGPEAMFIEPRSWHFLAISEDDANVHAHRNPLTSGEETELFLRYNYAHYRLCQLNESKKSAPSLDTIAEVALWHGRALKARNELVISNLPLIPALAKRMRITGVDFTDLLSEGYMAILRSVDKFNVSRGFKFSTYAYRAITNAFRRLADEAALYQVRFPYVFDTELEKPDKDWKTSGRVSEGDIEVLREALRLNTPGLSGVERHVIGERFPLEAGVRAKTLAGVARLVGLSVERIRQIEAAALLKICKAIKAEVEWNRRANSLDKRLCR